MKSLSSIAVCALFSFTASAQIQWEECLGGGGQEAASSVQQTFDSGYILACYSDLNGGDVTGNHGFSDYWVVKLSSSGSIQWQKSYGGSGIDLIAKIQQTTDSGFIVVGSSYSNNDDVSGNHGDSDYWVLKLSSTGVIQWQKSFGGSSGDYAQDVKQTSDGGYIIAGVSSSLDGDVSGNHGNDDGWIIKVSPSGSIEWQKSVGGSNNDEFNAISLTFDGGYILTGFTYSNDGDVAGNHGGYDGWVVKLSSLGGIQWQKCFGGVGGELFNSVEQTISDSGYIVAGFCNEKLIGVPPHPVHDYWITKLTLSGAIQWNDTLGGTDDDRANSIHQTLDGGYIIAGSTMSNDGEVTDNHGEGDSWVVKLSSSGSIQWQKCLGGGNTDYASSIQQTFDGGYIVVGGTTGSGGDVTGYHGGNGDAWVVKLGAKTAINNIDKPKSLSIVPNPATSFIRIVSSYTITDISITNLIGQTLFTNEYANGKVQIDVSNFPSGVYFIRINGTEVRRFVKL